MAKKRKTKDESEDKPFKLPKFDKEKFIKKEKRNIKTTIFSFILGFIVSLISFGFWALLSGNSMRWYLVIIFGILTGSWLKYFFLRLKIDLTDFTRKNWFTSYMIYFFTWLVILMILVNPPFYDEEKPSIELVVLPDMQEAGGSVKILAKITDNTGVNKDDITFILDDNSISSNNFEFIDNIFRYNYEGPSNLTADETHNFKITVKDSNGHTKEEGGSFTFSDDAIYLAKPQSGSLILAADDIKFAVNTEVWRVYYTVNNGDEINATQEEDREEYYQSYPTYIGWPAGENNATVRVSAKLLYNFVNHFVDGEPYWFENYINDTSTYSFNVANESTIGKTESPEIDELDPRFVSTPGFEIIIFLVSLGVVVLIFKYRKKDRRN